MDQLILSLITPSCGYTDGENTCQDILVQQLIATYSPIMNDKTLNSSYEVNGMWITPLEAAAIGAYPLMVTFMLQRGANPFLSSIPNVTVAQRIDSDFPQWRYNIRLRRIMELLGGGYSRWGSSCGSCSRRH